MAVRGRKPVPAALKVIRGNPGHRPIQEEPEVPARIPACPKELSGRARAEWRRVSRLLLDAGLIAELDRAALALYCKAWQRWLEAEERVERLGQVIETRTPVEGAPEGSPWAVEVEYKVNPAVRVSQAAADQIRKMLSEFGLSPQGRARVKASGGQGPMSDELEDLLGGTG